MKKGLFRFLICVLLLKGAEVAAAPESILKDATPLIYAVTLNKQDTDQTLLFVQDKDGKLFMPVDGLIKMRINPKGIPGVLIADYKNEEYVSLNSIPGLKYSANQTDLILTIDAPAEVFEKNDLDLEHEFIHPTPPPLGAYLNYDFYAQKDTSFKELDSLYDLGFFTHEGVFTSSFINKMRREDDGSGAWENHANLTRLDTTWQMDNPDKMTTLKLGDTYTTSGLWGQSVGFGGIQWATNFGTQPQYLTNPLPSLTGEAAIPSVTQLYVNNALVNQNSLAAGPFSINNIPVVSGAGSINLITTDLFGRQQVSNVSYYLSNDLLKKGLENFAYEAGFIRNNYGTNSNDYGRFAISVNHQKGITDNYTREYHVEWVDDQQTVGYGGTYLFKNFATIAFAGAISNSTIKDPGSARGQGALAQLNVQRQSFNGWSYGASATLTSHNFVQLGIQPGSLAPSMQSNVFLGIPIKSASLNLAYVQENNRSYLPITDTDGSIQQIVEPGNIQLVSASYSQTFFHTWAFSVTYLHSLSGPPNRSSLMLNLSRSISDRTNLNLGGSLDHDNGNSGNIQLQRSLPTGPGLGYNLYAEQGNKMDGFNYQATVNAQSDTGAYTLGIAQQDHDLAYQAEISGSIVWINESLYFSRKLDDSFAVVEIPGYPDVKVLSENQETGRTNKNGKLLVPNLIAYNENSISIDPNDLPIGTQVDKTDVTVIPYTHSGVLVKFPLKSNKTVTFKLMQKDGKTPVPAGIQLLTADGKETNFYIGDGGMGYVTGLNVGQNRFMAQWPGQTCYFKIVYPEQTVGESMIDLGNINCESAL